MIFLKIFLKIITLRIQNPKLSLNPIKPPQIHFRKGKTDLQKYLPHNHRENILKNLIIFPTNIISKFILIIKII